MMENRLSKKELLDWINVVSFAVDDVKLFLDTHPYDEEALQYFDEFKKQRVQAMKEYAIRHWSPGSSHNNPCREWSQSSLVRVNQGKP